MLVRIEVILKRLGLSRSNYQRLVRLGLMPHYKQKATVEGKRGYHYLYDEGEFEKAWQEYRDARRMGIGATVLARSYVRKAGGAIPKTADGLIEAIMKQFETEEGESLDDFQARYGLRRKELGEKSIEELRALFEPASTPEVSG